MDLRNKIPFFINYCSSGLIDTIYGTNSITFNAKANGLKALTLFGGTEQRNLPVGYTQYEYLRSTGTQYIDLGYKGNGNTKVEVKFKYYQTSSATGSGRVFGSRTTSSSNAFAIGSSSGIVASTGNKVFWCYDGQSFYVSDNTFALDDWQTVVFSATEHTINGATEGDDYNITTFETPSNLKLFAFDNNGTNGVGYVDIAYCKLWNNGVLVRDLIPAGDGTTYSMYDRVSGAMLSNAGTGDFEVGPEVVAPTPDTPVDIVCNNGAIKYSANIADVNTQTILLGYYISAQGVVAADANNWIYQNFIPVEPNTTYTLSLSSAVYFVSISEYSTADDSGFVIRKTGGAGSNTQLTITTSATTNFIRFGTNIDRTEITLEEVLAINWMLNEGGTALPYAPYAEGGIYTDGDIETIQDSLNNIATAEMPLKVGNYQDTQEVLSGRISKKVGIKVLDGTENWVANTVSSGRLVFYVTKVSVGSDSTVLPNGSPNIKCSHFETSTTAAQSLYGTVWVGGTAINFTAGDFCANLAAWRQWLANQYAAGTPVIIIYPLATPTTETVTGQHLTTQAGNNTISITQASLSNLELEAVYKRSK